MESDRERGSISDTSDGWSLVDVTPNDLNLTLQNTNGISSQASKEFLILDNNVDECFELTEMSLSDAPNPDIAGHGLKNVLQVEGPIESSNCKGQSWDEDSDGISVILDEEVTGCVNDRVGESRDSLEQPVTDAVETVEERLIATIKQNIEIPTNNDRIWNVPLPFLLSNAGLFAIGLVILVAARQIFLFNHERERERLAAEIDTLERLNAASEALQKQIRQSLDAMSRSVEALHGCSQSTSHENKDKIFTKDALPLQEPNNLKLEEILPLFTFFIDQNKLESLKILSKRLETALNNVNVADSILKLDEKITHVLVKLMQSEGDLTVLEQRLSVLINRLEATIRKERNIKRGLNIVQWFDSNDDDAGQVIFVKDEVKVNEESLFNHDVNDNKLNENHVSGSNSNKSQKNKNANITSKNQSSGEAARNFDNTIKSGPTDGSPKEAKREKLRKQKEMQLDKNKGGKKRFKSKKEWLSWQLERGNARESLRREGERNRYFRSTGMLVS